MVSSSQDDADVIVVGGGGSGLAAAIEARTAGASVILLEKNPVLGGSTGWSVGALTAAGTPHQKRARIADTADAHFEDLSLVTGALLPRDNLELRRILVDRAGETLEWLVSLGLVFVGPMPEPPHRHPRMHNVLPNSKVFAYRLSRHARKLGVAIRTGLEACELVQDSGRIAGVAVKDASGNQSVLRARRGVVLTTGDFSNARDLKARFADPALADIEAINPTATGDGHRLALAAGASVVNGDIVRGPIMRFVPPARSHIVQSLPPSRLLAHAMAWALAHVPHRILRPFFMSFVTTALGPSQDLFKEGAILVNRDGARFTDECGTPNIALARQPGRVAWIVLDRAIAQKFSAWPYIVSTAPGVAYAYLADYRSTRPDIYHESDTLEGLAVSMGTPPQALARAVAEYNEQQRGGRPALTTPPYTALGPAKSYIVFTDGGLRVTSRLEVMRGNIAIPGLFAAGSAGQGGLLLEGHGHHLMWAFVSGRLAGRAAALTVPADRAARGP